jgi:hypothetical protein
MSAIASAILRPEIGCIQQHATDGRSWPIAAYREHQIKMIRLLLDCSTLIAYSHFRQPRTRDRNYRGEISGCHPEYDEFPNVNVYSSCDEWQSFENADVACDVPRRLRRASARGCAPTD